MGMSSSNQGGSMSEINITPLVDVLLVLLIIFMVTTAASEQKKTESQKKATIAEETKSIVALNLPVTENNPLFADPETSKLVMIIDANLRVFLTSGLSDASERSAKPIADCKNFKQSTKISDWASCFDSVQANLGGTIDTVNRRLINEGIYLQADATAPYGFVAGVMARLRLLGVDRIDIVTNPSFDMGDRGDGAAPAP
jgi:biopolymer transport protein TolR